MNSLTRTGCGADGVFGNFTFDGDSSFFMVTLEHAFQQDDGTYAPVIPAGQYMCVRGVHQLSNGVPFTTFEITGVSGHSGLLFHAGNFNRDSEGCVLCGDQHIAQLDGQGMITGSRLKFQAFMDRLIGVSSFMLEVSDA
jgi:hypothetical protein